MSTDCLYVFNKKLEFLGIIDDFISLRWRRKYFEAGEFEVVTKVDTNILNLVSKDNIIIKNSSLEAGIIEVIDINDDGNNIEIDFSGRFLSSILDRRIIKSTINFNGTYINGMKKLLNSMTPFSALEIEDTLISTKNVEFQCTYKNVYEYLVKLSKACNIGFRIVPDIKNKKYLFQFYEGVDRTSKQVKNERYSFSDTMENIEKAEYIYSSKSEYNYILVGGQGEGSERVLVEINNGNHSDFDLRELFVDAKDENNDGLTEEEYIAILTERGNEKQTKETMTFETSVYAVDYKIKWDLGDVVNVSKENWGIVTTLRIIEIEEVIEENTNTVTVTFGSSLPEKFESEEK